jgi:glycosyltransferase involved in cell wall biosynthesis
LAQTEPDWELIVVDDGSTDCTPGIARDFAARDKRIKVTAQANAGTAVARNAGAQLATGDWILPFDADDLLLPHALAAQLRFIERHKGCEASTWGQRLLMPDGSLEVLPASFGLAVEHEYSLEQVVTQRTAVGCTVWWKAALFRNLRGYRDTFAEDYELMLRACVNGVRVLHNPEVCQLYRIHNQSKSRANLSKQLRDVAAVSRRLLRECDAPAEVRKASHSWNQANLARARATDSEAARSQFRWAAGVPADGATRRVYLRALGRRPSLRDRWLLLAPIALASPRVVSRWLFSRHDSGRSPG